MPVITPRASQIMELVRGHALPLVALQREHLEIIAEAIGAAWLDLVERHAPTLASGDEPEINSLLVTRLNALLDEHPLWSQMVRSVSRDPSHTNFDGGHLEKKPDVAIHLTCRNPNFPLIVECKILDGVGQKDVTAYCRSGLKRFLVGQYAWPAREAFMLAYVRDGSSISSTLAPYLEASACCAVEAMPEPVNVINVDGAHSTHKRTFKYVVGPPDNQEPGSISVWHLWIKAA